MNSSQRLLLVGIVVVLTVGTAGTVAYTLATRQEAGEDRLSVVATFYPLAYLAERIGGDHAVVRTLIPHNSELHAWEPSTSDILAVEESDIFVYNGAGLEPWVVQDILPAITTDDKVIVDATKDLDLPASLDPHTWIDPVLAKGEAEVILEAYVEADPTRAGAYQANAQQLFSKFDAIISSYESELVDAELDA
ncbi:MAG: zinc ABC transporter solute-binding protein, partial [Anaerolineae bacterium]|nr:zinc ABC transporter solute-binding protein [Anaerolineae bacterium]NIN96166.1 zinc ABC transporter solute-binding protein [Anaerolineae bacterium]